MDDKINILKEKLGEDGLDRLAGLSEKCFFIKKEDIKEYTNQHSLVEKNILVADKSRFIPVDLTSDTTIQAEEPRRNPFRCSFTIVDKQEECYNDQMLVVCVLPVFSRSLFPVTPPHLPFQVRDRYTMLYRNRHNFFYAAMRNLFSDSFSKKSEAEQLFERLETAQYFGNYEV